MHSGPGEACSARLVENGNHPAKQIKVQQSPVKGAKERWQSGIVQYFCQLNKQTQDDRYSMKGINEFM
jgi:hypothetical protein